MVITAMTLGTAWAVRGKFGHEQGAAWAGAIGGLVIILLSGRKDWYQKVYTAALAAAIGWGMGGMMSYGRVVGYGRTDDFPNAFYGLLMLFIIGGLYGLTGGGLFGLALAQTKEKKVNWPRLIVEMTIGGFLFYGFFVAQLGWRMTPPRSELWAGCMGAGLAMVWFLYRNKWTTPLRIALFAMLGGGFGFASGNFLQIVINSFEINFSGWNLMEYSIGFWGGLGMAYGVFTSEWEKPEKSLSPAPMSSGVALLAVALIIPFIVWQQTFTLEKITELVNQLDWANVNAGVYSIWLIVIGLILVMAVVLYFNFRNTKGLETGRKNVFLCFILLFAVYIIISDIRTGSYFTWALPEQKLYWVNFVIILLLTHKVKPLSWKQHKTEFKYINFWILFSAAIILIAILALIAIHLHGQLDVSHQRFPL